LDPDYFPFFAGFFSIFFAFFIIVVLLLSFVAQILTGYGERFARAPRPCHPYTEARVACQEETDAKWSSARYSGASVAVVPL
jgi:hypothetical protein